MCSVNPHAPPHEGREAYKLNIKAALLITLITLIILIIKEMKQNTQG